MKKTFLISFCFLYSLTNCIFSTLTREKIQTTDQSIGKLEQKSNERFATNFESIFHGQSLPNNQFKNSLSSGEIYCLKLKSSTDYENKDLVPCPSLSEDYKKINSRNAILILDDEHHEGSFSNRLNAFDKILVGVDLLTLPFQIPFYLFDASRK